MAASEEARARWAHDAKALVGQLVGGKYRIEAVLGRGGMGTIYRAEQQPLGRKVALKLLHSTLGTGSFDPEFQRRFLLEAAVVAGLQHPNIVVLHDYGTLEDDTGACYMVMELIQGRTITEHLAHGPFDPIRALRITREIARALRAAHAMEVIHRDLKPANVMLCPTPEGEAVKVLDFGLVKVIRDDSEELTAEGRFLGSPRYMSPEQIQRLPMDGRSDLYSLGVILYRMLGAQEPFVADQAFLTLMAHLQAPYPPIEERTGVKVPAEIEAIVERLLEKEPGDRFGSADELIAAIDRLWPGYSEEPLVSGVARLASGPYAVRVVDSGESGALPAPGQRTNPPDDASTLDALADHGLEPAPDPVAAAPSATVEAPPARGRLAALAIVGTVCVAALGGAFLATRLLSDDTPAPRASMGAGPTGVVPPAGPTDGEPPPDVTSPPAVARPFTLHVRSVPSGARVVRDGVELGVTPLDVDLDANALEDHPATFMLRSPGRAPHVFTQGPSDGDVTVTGALPRIATGHHRPNDGTHGGGDPTIKLSR